MGLGKVTADPGQIEQVVMNLAVNARDAMPDGGKLTIETAYVELDDAYSSQHVGMKPGPYVMLSVSDTGCGIDERTRTRLFEPFFTTKQTGKGTGLGLATVYYGIVKQSGGSIWVYSEPGHGTTFKVYLPRELSAKETAERGPQVTTGAAGAETILVVEDEGAVRNLAKRILDGAGYTVLTAANGGEALVICGRQQGSVGLVLTDVVMPGMKRQGAGRSSGQPPAQPAGSLHVGIHRRCHRPPWRAGPWHALHRQALQRGRSNPHGARGT